jgi:hypothetical protein
MHTFCVFKTCPSCHTQVPSPNSGPSLVPEHSAGTSQSSGSGGGGGGGGGAGSGGAGGGSGGDSYYRSSAAGGHPDGSRHRSSMQDMEVGSGMPNLDSDVDGSADIMDEMFVDEPPALRSFYADIRRQQQQSSSGRDRGGPSADPARQLRSALSVDHSEHRRVNVIDSASPGSERSPLISDGNFLYIISRSHDRNAQSVSHLQHHSDLHEDEEESSEGGGQIGSTWAVASFSLDVYDPGDGMRLVRSVGIKGPACDQGMREGEAEISLCCDVCGLLMTGAMVGYRCLVCAPEYDLCQHCHTRGAATGGHRPEHAVRQMDPTHVPSHDAAEHQMFLTAFPAECLEHQSFYCDGKVLMVLIPPHLFGSKTPGYLCRVFSAQDGRHLYDISMGDAQDDTRRGLGKSGQAGAACFDRENDLVWHVDHSASRARRWRHPWTTVGQAKEEWQRAKELPEKATLKDALQSILACLYTASEKLSRSVQEPCHDVLQPWTPFCVEAVPDMFAAISRILTMCAEEPHQSTQHIVRTCMRLLQINVGHNSGQSLKAVEVLRELREPVVRLASTPTPEQDSNNNMDVSEASSSAGTKSSHPHSADARASICAEAACALVAGFDVFYADAEQQAQLLCDMLSKDTDTRDGDDRVLFAIATQLAKPGAHHHIFRVFDGNWLKVSADRCALAKRLLTLLVGRVLAHERAGKPAGISEAPPEPADNTFGCLLSLLGAFQRHILSTPLSSIRATSESEDLLLFYAKHLMTGCNDLLKAAIVPEPSSSSSSSSTHQDANGLSTKLSQGPARVLLQPFVTALVDPIWSQNVSGNLARDLLEVLRGLIGTCDTINRASPTVTYQDAAFAVRCTEPRYIGGKIVSIPRTRSAKACCVKIPGAVSMIVRLGDDMVLGKRETVRIQSYRDSSSTGSTSNTIKGGHKGKRLWRSFAVQGDTVYITYNRSGSSHDDPKSPRLIRCSVYGCAKTTGVLMPLDWMFDLELTLAALLARFTRTALQEPPRPVCRSPWINSPFFQRGLKLASFQAMQLPHGETKSSAEFFDHASAAQANQERLREDAMQLDTLVGRGETDQTVLELLGSNDDSTDANKTFASFVAGKMREQLATSSIWKSTDMHITLGLRCVAALITATGLTDAAAQFSEKLRASPAEQLPAGIMFIVQTSIDVVQGVIMDLRRQQQMAVLRHAEETVSQGAHPGSAGSIPNPAGARADAVQMDAGSNHHQSARTEGASRSSAGASHADDMMCDDDVDMVKKRIEQACEAKIVGMNARARLLTACQNAGDDAWLKQLRSLTTEEQKQISAGQVGALQGEHAQAFRLCVKTVTRFLLSDAEAYTIVMSALACARVAAQRIDALSGMQTLLRGIQFTSVRQTLVRCMSVCVCVCVFVCVCVHTCIHAHDIHSLYIFVCIYIHLYAHTCTYMYTLA